MYLPERWQQQHLRDVQQVQGEVLQGNPRRHHREEEQKGEQICDQCCTYI